MGRHSVDKRNEPQPDRPRRSRRPTIASGDDTSSPETSPHLASPTLLSGATTSPSGTTPHTGAATATHGRHRTSNNTASPPPATTAHGRHRTSNNTASPPPATTAHGRHTTARGRHTTAQPGSRRYDGLGVVALILAISAFAAAGLRLWQIGGIPLALTLIPGAELGNSPLLSIGVAIVAAMALVLGAVVLCLRGTRKVMVTIGVSLALIALVGITTSWGMKIVFYEVTGVSRNTAVNFVDFDNGNRVFKRATGQNLPWMQRIVVSGNTDLSKVFLDASKDPANGNKVSCKIMIDGKVVSQSTATGEAVNVECFRQQAR